VNSDLGRFRDLSSHVLAGLKQVLSARNKSRNTLVFEFMNLLQLAVFRLYYKIDYYITLNYVNTHPVYISRILYIIPVSTLALGPTQSPVQWVPAGPFPGGKARTGPDADHSPPCSAEIKNE
jgi:hypothetical protein